jgi:3-dehydrotetronate 4-kinase
MAAILGCIADDFTGGTDLAGMLVKHGMRAVQMIGVPHAEPCPAEVDAVVVALKSRTTPAAEAISESVAALRWLEEAGCKQFYFKYCSTFDSPAGQHRPGG